MNFSTSSRDENQADFVVLGSTRNGEHESNVRGPVPVGLFTETESQERSNPTNR